MFVALFSSLYTKNNGEYLSTLTVVLQSWSVVNLKKETCPEYFQPVVRDKSIFWLLNVLHLYVRVPSMGSSPSRSKADIFRSKANFLES